MIHTNFLIKKCHLLHRMEFNKESYYNNDTELKALNKGLSKKVTHTRYG